MSEERVRLYASERGFHPKTLERWIQWEAQDRDALLDLASGLKIGENHLRDLMDWLEEIALRDAFPIHQIVAQKAITEVASDPRLGRSDRLKKIKEQLRRWRFPRLSETEDKIRAWIGELKLPPEIRLSVPPGLEGGKLHVEFAAATHDDFRNLSVRLAETAAKESLSRVFAVLAGRDAGEPSGTMK